MKALNLDEPSGAAARREARHRTQAKQGAHIGATEKIRQALKEGPAGSAEIAERTGLPARVVVSMVMQMLARGGGVVTLGGRKHRSYALANTVQPKALELKNPGPYAFATSRTTEFRPLRRDPFELMKLNRR